MKPAALLVLLVAALASHRHRQRRAAPPARPAAAAPRPGQPLSAVLLFGGRLDLDAATVEDLEALPGIGPIRARRIAGQRGAHRSLEAVPGIGRRTVEALRRYLQIH